MSRAARDQACSGVCHIASEQGWAAGSPRVSASPASREHTQAEVLPAKGPQPACRPTALPSLARFIRPVLFLGRCSALTAHHSRHGLHAAFAVTRITDFICGAVQDTAMCGL